MGLNVEPIGRRVNTKEEEKALKKECETVSSHVHSFWDESSQYSGFPVECEGESLMSTFLTHLTCYSQPC